MTPVLRRWLVGAAIVAMTAATADLRAQSVTPVIPVETLFADAMAKESAVRQALLAAAPAPTVLKAVRTVVSDYETVVRSFPASAFCDDALWRAAQLSSAAFAVFHDPQEQSVAVRLLQAISSRYPTSRFTKQAPAQLALLKAVPAGNAVRTESVASVTPPRAVPVRLATTPSGKLATIKAIRRAVIGEIVRVVIELDREVTFHDERLDNPARVFVDLPATQAEAPLKDQTIRFDGDADPVRQVRIGRHPNNTTRVVLETAGVSSYSVYPLYSPYRLVIDCLRASPVAGLDVLPPFPAPAKPAPPADLAARRVDLGARALPSVLPVALAALAEAAIEPAEPVAANLPASPVVAAATVPSLPLGSPSRNLAGGFSIARQLGLSVSRIVIDPGHGGHDPGARGGGTTEAELVLDVSLRLEQLLQKVPGVYVALTRRGDDYVPLQERTAIANRENADLFLSIHANANSSPQAQGIETYFLNFATNLSAAAVAARENAASGQSMGELPDVVKTIALHNKLDESRDFATFVQREMMSKLRPANKGLRDLGVKQAPFVVLIGAAMPSVLSEVAFMTNPQNAKLIKSSSYRQKIAEALFEAIRAYQTSLKKQPALARESQ